LFNPGIDLWFSNASYLLARCYLRYLLSRRKFVKHPICISCATSSERYYVTFGL